VTSYVLASAEPLLGALVRGVTALDPTVGIFATSALSTSALQRATPPLGAVFVANPAPSWSIERIDRAVRAYAPSATVSTAFIRERSLGEPDRVEECVLRWLRTTPAGPGGATGAHAMRCESCLLGPDPTTPAGARRFVHSVLERWERPDLLDAAVLCASELTTNAVLHAPRSSVQIALAAVGLSDAEVHLSVMDRNTAHLPVGRRPTVRSHGGRGLRIVDACSSRWGVTVTEADKRVWCVFGGPVRSSDGTVADEVEAADPPLRHR
jgi:anti-sigma regulatory factor (Ser/Thr protein kinase)